MSSSYSTASSPLSMMTAADAVAFTTTEESPLSLLANGMLDYQMEFRRLLAAYACALADLGDGSKLGDAAIHMAADHGRHYSQLWEHHCAQYVNIHHHFQ